jgi:tetratricopeptide (TPR) repeat protein
MDRAAGNALFKEGKYAEAIKIYEQLEGDHLAWSNCAECHLLQGEGEEAMECARMALEIDSHHSKSYSRLARGKRSCLFVAFCFF